jgi:hypothetical protein
MTKFTENQCREQLYPHNNRGRYTDGFQCEDCGNFYPKGSEDYTRYEYLSTLRFVIHNIKVSYIRNNRDFPSISDELLHKLEVASSWPMEDLNKLVNDAIDYIHSEGGTDKDATIIIK